jgi:5'-AMP-activated protein kinase regulatory beta subunit
MRTMLCCPICAVHLQYKFIVDGDWKHDPNQRAMRDENGNVNNVIEVQEYVPENLENISGFDPPPSPAARYAGPALLPLLCSEDVPLCGAFHGSSSLAVCFK